MTMGLTQPNQMKQRMAEFEIVHNALLVKVTRLVLYNSPFEGGER
jgi:hypothetical protein